MKRKYNQSFFMLKGFLVEVYCKLQHSFIHFLKWIFVLLAPLPLYLHASSLLDVSPFVKEEIRIIIKKSQKVGESMDVYTEWQFIEDFISKKIYEIKVGGSLSLRIMPTLQKMSTEKSKIEESPLETFNENNRESDRSSKIQSSLETSKKNIKFDIVDREKEMIFELGDEDTDFIQGQVRTFYHQVNHKVRLEVQLSWHQFKEQDLKNIFTQLKSQIKGPVKNKL